MKNSARYAKKIKKILSGAHKDQPDPEADGIRLMIRGILAEDVTGRQAASAMETLEDEFVDYNELRVSPVKDIVECLGRGFPGARAKAEMINRALNGAFEHVNLLSLDFLAHLPKREVRKTLREKLGLSPYAESIVTLYGFEGHAIPVDRLLLESLKSGGHIDAGSDVADLQGFLERIIGAKDDHGAHEALRQFAAKQAAKLHKEWVRQAKKEAEARAKAEAEARARAEARAKAKAEAEAKAKAEAEARAKAEAEAKAKAEVEARKKAEEQAKEKEKADLEALRKKRAKAAPEKKIEKAVKPAPAEAEKKEAARAATVEPESVVDRLTRNLARMHKHS